MGGGVRQVCPTRGSAGGGSGSSVLDIGKKRQNCGKRCNVLTTILMTLPKFGS